MHINMLPSELLVLIFSKIDDFSQKIELEKICRHWRRIIALYWETTKICPVPLDNLLTLDLVLKRCGENLEELWFQNLEIDKKLVKQMAKRMKQLKHLKLSNCKLDGPAMDSISDLFGKQLCSFILDETSYHPSMRRLLENESSKLEHLSLNLSRNFFAEALPNKLPSHLKSFSLCNKFYGDSSNLILLSIIARDCKNLKVLHLEIRTLCSEISMAIGNIKSLVYLNLEVKSIENEDELKHVLCHELPNLKAIKIGGYCNEETVYFICNARPDLVHLNVFARHAFQISDSLNSLTLRISTTVNFVQFFPYVLIIKKNESIQHLDIRSIILPSYGNFIEELLGQFPNLKALHCKMPTTDAEFNSIFCLFEKHLKKGRKINIYFHFAYEHFHYYKFILPDDLPLFSGVDWKPKIWSGKCENFLLKKLIEEAIDGRNEPSFMDEWWME